MELITNDGYTAVNMSAAVAVLCYSMADGVISQIGVVDEKFPFHSSGRIEGIVAGKMEPSDKTMLSRARAELKEEAGYEVPDNSRWKYLGEFSRGKIIITPIYCFAVDVTDIPRESPKGDGSEGEADIKFEMKDLADALENKDLLTHACFFNLFKSIYKNSLQ